MPRPTIVAVILTLIALTRAHNNARRAQSTAAIPATPQLPLVQHGLRCGTGDAHVKRRAGGALPVPQHYHTEEMYATLHGEAALVELRRVHGGGRSAQTLNYSNGLPFEPISRLHAAGLTAPIRIVPVWDAVALGRPNGGLQRACRYVGDIVTVSSASGGNSLYNCTAANVGTANTTRYAQMRSRTQAAAAYWARALSVRPVLNAAITIAPSIVSQFGLSTGLVPAADVVLIMTDEPSPFTPIAGFAECLQVDQYHRCTVGWFNWVPELLDTANSGSPATITSELHTAMHEIAHVLGGMGPGVAGASIFIDDAGAPVSSGIYVQQVDPAYPQKSVTWIVTPRVVNVTRRDFNCPTMIGFPLEDEPLGAGVHWEARLAGGELMSYGTYSTATFVGDITLAFFEDTGQYVANYSVAGTIPTGVPNADDYGASNNAFVASQSVDTTVSGYVPPAAPSPGALLWGFGAGCDFVNAPATDWSPEYTCTKQAAYGCTADNRMSAVCVVTNSYTAEPSCASEGIYDGATGGAQCGLQNPVVQGTSSHGVPPPFRFFSSDADAAAATGVSGARAATTGGQLPSMDYAPVWMGYWSCLDSAPSANGTAQGGDAPGGLSSISGLFGGSQSDMALFGGQARCEDCRCMESSLLEITRSVNPAFPLYGLCYRVNCYMPDYLQVAVINIFGSASWYHCPVDGTKLYIPGFTGALHCPDPVSYCARERITGVKFAETNAIWEMILWGTVAAVVLFFACSCLMPCTRRCLIARTKSCCGARQFEEDFIAYASRGGGRRHVVVDAATGEPVRAALDPCASWYMFVLNIPVLCLALAVIGIGMWVMLGPHVLPSALQLIVLSFLIAVLATIGLCGSRKRAKFGPSCCLLTYFFGTSVLVVMLLWSIIYLYAVAGWSTYIKQHADVVLYFMPSSYASGTNASQQISSATATVTKFADAMAAAIALVTAAFLGALFAAGRLIGRKTLSAMALAVGGWMLLAFGIIMVGVGLYIVATGSLVSNNALVVEILVLVIGFWGVVTGGALAIGALQRRRAALFISVVLLVLGGALLCFTIVVCVTATGTLVDFVADMSDADVARLAHATQTAYTRADLIASVNSGMKSVAIASGVILGVLIVEIIAAYAYVRFNRERDDWLKTLSTRRVVLNANGEIVGTVVDPGRAQVLPSPAPVGGAAPARNRGGHGSSSGRDETQQTRARRSQSRDTRRGGAPSHSRDAVAAPIPVTYVNPTRSGRDSVPGRDPIPIISDSRALPRAHREFYEDPRLEQRPSPAMHATQREMDAELASRYYYPPGPSASRRERLDRTQRGNGDFYDADYEAARRAMSANVVPSTMPTPYPYRGEYYRGGQGQESFDPTPPSPSAPVQSHRAASHYPGGSPTQRRHVMDYSKEYVTPPGATMGMPPHEYGYY